jgi:hypothetical protein
MIAPCVRDGKCFDKSDNICIERPRSQCLQTAPVIDTFFALFLHAAPIMRSISSVERARQW